MKGGSDQPQGRGVASFRASHSRTLTRSARFLSKWGRDDETIQDSTKMMLVFPAKGGQLLAALFIRATLSVMNGRPGTRALKITTCIMFFSILHVYIAYYLRKVGIHCSKSMIRMRWPKLCRHWRFLLGGTWRNRWRITLCTTLRRATRDLPVHPGKDSVDRLIFSVITEEGSEFQPPL